MLSLPGITGEQESTRTRPATGLARGAAKPLDTRSTRGDVMKIGDLVRNLNSESRMLGVIVDIGPIAAVVSWIDGRVSPINWTMLEAVNENR